MPAPVAGSTPIEEGAYVGRIPIRNLWFLMFYASDLARMQGGAKRALEESPNDIPDLVGEILAYTVDRRLRRHLSLGYRTDESELHRVRGRINLLTTERRRLLARGLVACRYDELTIDTVRNRFVRAALEAVSRLASSPEVIQRCRGLARTLLTMGVSGLSPTLQEMSTDRAGRYELQDQYMVAAARLVFQLALPTEMVGSTPLPLADREEHWVRKLFERAVGGFFGAVLERGSWNVHAGRQQNWQITSKSAGIDRILPSMKTDIVLDHRDSGRRIVIDTKFASILSDGWYRKESLNSGYVYQIYAYLRSQVDCGDLFSDCAEGVLLHPSIGTTIDEEAMIQRHRIRFMTVDLTKSPAEIRSELLKIGAREVLTSPTTSLASP